MKVTHTAIHKLMVQADCQCAAVGEFSDAAFKNQLGATTFVACSTHKDTPGLDLFSNILSEVLAKEAREMKLPAPPPALHLERAKGEAPPAVVTKDTPGAPTAPPRIASPAEGGQVSRTTIRGQHRPSPPGGTPRVVGTGAMGVRRADIATSSSRSPHGLNVAKAASGGSGAPSRGGAEMFDEADEDRRVTDLLENSGLLDLDEDDNS